MTIIQTGKGRKRSKKDFYPTPPELARASLQVININTPSFVLDVGAGNGTWGREFRRVVGNNYDKLDGIEIDSKWPPVIGYDSWIQQDFLTYNPTIYTYNLIIGNPPYSLAEECIRHSYTMLPKKGNLLFLLRLAFLEGQNRNKGLWKEMPPKKVWVSSRRPSFTGNGHTDDTAYALFFWEKGFKGKWTGDWLMWEYDNVKNNEFTRA